jgi:hypothetical protein
MLMTVDRQYEYDVAFSFLKEDETLAIALNERLQGRLATFLYSRNQETVAGTDGELTFSRIFGKDARIVVVLYREGWGTTPFTRIESTAIRNRAFDEGYDFTILVPLDSPPKAPDWLPKNRIWVGLERWGLDGAAAAIETRVQEYGGIPKEETVAERAARLQREAAAESDRASFLGSSDGVESAKVDLKSLFDRIENLAGEVKQASGLRISIEREERGCVAFSGSATVALTFVLQWGNSLDQSELLVRLWQGTPRILGHRAVDDSKLRRDERWEYDRDKDGITGWRRLRNRTEFLSNQKFADYCLELLLDEHARSSNRR